MIKTSLKRRDDRVNFLTSQSEIDSYESAIQFNPRHVLCKVEVFCLSRSRSTFDVQATIRDASLANWKIKTYNCTMTARKSAAIRKSKTGSAFPAPTGYGVKRDARTGCFATAKSVRSIKKNSQKYSAVLKRLAKK